MKTTLLTLTGLIIFTAVSGATDISGPVSGVWDPSGNPYNLVGDIWIPAGEILTLLPGVNIDWENDSTRFTATGRLEALGSSTDSIDITSAPGDYLLIYFELNGSNADLLQYVNLNGQISMSGAGHVLENTQVYYETGQDISEAIAIIGPVADVEITDCIIVASAYRSWPWYGTYATGISQVNGLIEHSIITVSATNTNDENISAAEVKCVTECMVDIRNCLISGDAEWYSADMGGSNSYGIVLCSGNIENNVMVLESNGGPEFSYGVSSCAGDVINNTIVFPRYDNECCGIKDTDGNIVNNILSCSSENGFGIISMTITPLSIKYNCIYGFESAFFNPPPDTIDNIFIDPLFVDPDHNDYHLQSTVGSYHGGSWLPDPEYSLCIDAGDPESNFIFEPMPNGGRINMGAYGGTEEASKSTNLGMGQIPDEIPTEFMLHQNYPNPFNPTTAISYQLSENSFVDLSVYDISGKKITELLSGWREAGYHEVTFNASALSSGLYIYHIQSDEFTSTKKMLLIK
jgi:hypothetical protein